MKLREYQATHIVILPRDFINYQSIDIYFKNQLKIIAMYTEMTGLWTGILVFIKGGN